MYEDPEAPRNGVAFKSIGTRKQVTRVLVLALPFVCHLGQVLALLQVSVLHL